jgi:hypothetical protein
MKARIIPVLTILLASMAGLFSCSADGGNIYWTIQNEIKTTDNTLPSPKTWSVYDVTAVGSGGPYYLAAGGIYQGTLDRTALTVTWKPNATDATWYYNPPGEQCNALVLYSLPTPAMWGGFITTSGTIVLLKSDSSFSFAASVPVSDPAIAGKDICLLQVANNVLFAVSQNKVSFTYDLDYTTDGVTWYASAGLQGFSSPVTGIAYDGAQYWATTAVGTQNMPTVFKSSPGNPASFASATPQPAFASDDYIRGITAGAGLRAGWLFLPTKKGGIYYSTNSGTTWSDIPAPVVSSVTVGFLTVAGPVDAASNLYLAGADGYGYYTINMTTPSTPTLTRFATSTIDLYGDSVSKILVDSSTPSPWTVFMGTNGKGLWRASFDSSTGDLISGSAWTHE